MSTTLQPTRRRLPRASLPGLEAILFFALICGTNAGAQSSSPDFGTGSRSFTSDRKVGGESFAQRSASIITVLNGRRFDLAKSSDFDAFLTTVTDLRALSKEEKAEKKQDKAAEKRTKNGSGADGQVAETEADVRAENPSVRKSARGRDWSGKKVRAGLKALESLAEEIRANRSDRTQTLHNIQEICTAIESNFATAEFWRSRLEITDIFFKSRDLTLNPCGRGSSERPASNLAIGETHDLSLADPAASTFWSPPSPIERCDLYLGYGRSALPNFAEEMCTYDSPHKGSGVHPSFEVTIGDGKWKVKFGEERSSGPFAGRIYSALGYPADATDYAREVKVRWDRRILTHFNDRQPNTLRVSALRIQVLTLHTDPYHDPFAFIESVVLDDGSRVGPAELRKRLFTPLNGRSLPKRPERIPALYNRAFESRIEYVVMKDASFTPKDTGDREEIGCWDYNGLGHETLREVRALAVLDAWLDNWDVRWGNNRLSLIESKDGGYALEHRVTDVGGLFGNSSGMLRMVHGKLKEGLYQNVPNDFGWTFTHSQPDGETTVPFRDYMPIAKNAAFYELNLDDARWMARRIARFTEEQLKSALIASGYDAATARLLLEKLVSRRDEMVKDLGLHDEIPLLRPDGVDRQLSYNPQTDGPFEATTASGARVGAHYDGKYILVRGFLRENRRTRSAITSRGAARPRTIAGP